jgi:hypothetical protein
MPKNLYEIFEEFEKAETNEERVDVLRRNNNYALFNVLQLTFHPASEFMVDKIPYYKPENVPPGMGHSTIHQELDRVYLMIKNHPRCPPTLTEKRREELLVQMLEALEAKEAVVYMNMFLKNLKVKGLDAKIVREAFPGIIPE